MTRNVAVIGGGTGLTTAWALENQSQFNVTVFEKSDNFGGHIQSLKVGNAILEGGAEFIGNKSIYPNVHKLFEHLKIVLQQFELNMDFHDTVNKHHTILPPVLHTSDEDNNNPSRLCNNLLGFFSCIRKSKVQKETHISLHTLFHDLLSLLKMNEIINRAKNKLAHPDQLTTLEDFVNSFINEEPLCKASRAKFADTFLYPLIAAGWGVSVKTIKTYGAHYAMHYLAAGSDWFDAPEGLSSYIRKLISECTHAQFKNNTEIKRVIPIEIDGETKYLLLKNDDTYFTDEYGTTILYDDVVITSPANVTSELISGIGGPQIEELKQKLSRVQYYDTTVVFHRDPAYLSQNETVVHTRYDGEYAANTMCKEWKFPGETPIMKTWVLPGQPMPQNILHTAQYKHPVMNRDYYEAQMALHHTQGVGGLWWGGILAGFNDSHESGVTVALEVAARLNIREHCLDTNKRLALFPDVIESIKAESQEHYLNHPVASSSLAFT